jgi:hypothetical protein
MKPNYSTNYPHCQKPMSTFKESIILNGGFLEKVGEDSFSANSELLPFLTLGYHINNETAHFGLSNDLIQEENHTLGQFELNFCSIVCLRKWFEEKVMKLEQDIKNHKND